MLTICYNIECFNYNNSFRQVISESAIGPIYERERERSTSRPPPATLAARGNVLAELDEGKLFELKEVSSSKSNYRCH